MELVSSFFTDYPPWLSLPAYIAGDSIGYHMESALGPESICIFPYGITLFQIYSYTDLTNLDSIFFIESCCHMKSQGFHKETPKIIWSYFWISQRLLRSEALSGIWHCSLYPLFWSLPRMNKLIYEMIMYFLRN